MKTLSIYDDFGEIECLAGDTFTLYVEIEPPDTEGALACILARHSDPGTAVLTRDCIRTGTGVYCVTITADDTASLGGEQMDLHFRLTAPDGFVYRRLRGTLYVRHAAKGAAL